MSGQSEGSFQSPDEEAACESPYGSVSPPRDLPGTSLGDPSEYVADFNEIQRVIVHHGSCTGERCREGGEKARTEEGGVKSPRDRCWKEKLTAGAASIAAAVVLGPGGGGTRRR